MKTVLRILASLLAGAMGAWACTAPDLPIEDVSEGMDLSLSLSVGRTASPASRMTDIVVQNEETGSFRGIEKLFIIPFLVDGPISSVDERFGDNLLLPQEGLPANSFGTDAQGGAFPGLVLNNNAHLFNPVYIRKGTRSVLSYGKAIDEAISVAQDSVAFKARNGSLRAYGLEEGRAAQDIHFNLDPITNGTALETELENLLGYLNAIAATTVNYQDHSYTWARPAGYGNQAVLTAAFHSFVFDGQTFAGSSLALNRILTELYQSVYPLKGADSAAGALASAIIANISDTRFVTISGLQGAATVALNCNFPAHYGVPAGSVTLQWNGTAFWRPTRAAGCEAVSLTSFCYPPNLWYYTNSSLVVSEEESITDEYNYYHTTWSDITNLYSSSSVVAGGVQSVAIRKQLQYGVALLDITLKPVASSRLKDSKSNWVSVESNQFPITGVILGEQRNLAYDFTPSGETMYYAYDKEVNDGSTPKTYISSQTFGLARKTVQILTTQTLPQEDVHLALEFQNNSGSDFYGHNGDRIVAGSRFYLFATLKYTDAVNNSSSILDCILFQDHVTTVSFYVDTLAEAYSTIPEMKSPQLQLGVRAEVEWILSTPVTISVK